MQVPLYTLVNLGAWTKQAPHIAREWQYLSSSKLQGTVSFPFEPLRYLKYQMIPDYSRFKSSQALRGHCGLDGPVRKVRSSPTGHDRLGVAISNVTSRL
jgi:hypothetical protein